LITVLTVFALINLPAGTSARETKRIGQSSSQDRARDYLAREVRHELVMLPYYSVFDWLEFQTQSDGTVVLSGQVTRPTLKSDAENVVKRIEGVTNVVNRIEVLPLSPNDDRIRRAVYRSLFNSNSPLFRYGLGAVPSIHIIVRNGNVTLKGLWQTSRIKILQTSRRIACRESFRSGMSLPWRTLAEIPNRGCSFA
jgi:osmotically-inducible protein OsmY